MQNDRLVTEPCQTKTGTTVLWFITVESDEIRLNHDLRHHDPAPRRKSCRLCTEIIKIYKQSAFMNLHFRKHTHTHSNISFFNRKYKSVQMC